jgi:hypothetical protein
VSLLAKNFRGIRATIISVPVVKVEFGVFEEERIY